MMVLPKIYHLLFILSITYISSSEELASDVIVQLKDGKIRGRTLKSENGNDYYAFQEIPYAAPPVGKYRFKLPQKVKRWKGTLNTTKNTKICYQSFSQYNLEISEDCLYINVYTPVRPGRSEKLSVLLWIHGGADAIGSGAYEYYGPKYLMDYGIVVVTINYRVGPFGYITTDDDILPGNLGHKDQKYALEWVKNNIHLFEGDSNKVTIMGQSSGSNSVGLLVLGQRNSKNELFRGAIMQSGTPLLGYAQATPRENAFSCGRAVDKNFVSNDSTDLLKLLQEAPAESILKVCSGNSIIEKEGDFSVAPLQSLIDGNFGKIPILMGFTSEEFLKNSLSANESTRISLDIDPGKLVPGPISISSENRSAAGKRLKEIYTKTSFEEDVGAYARWSSDNNMIDGVCKHAKLIAAQVPVHFYQFSYYGELGQGPSDIIPGAERVAHGADNHYIWSNDNVSDLSKFSETDRLTLRRVIKLWTNFVKYQNPTPKVDPLLDDILWPTTNSANLLYLNINGTLQLKNNPRHFKEVETVLDSYMEPPFIYY